MKSCWNCGDSIPDNAAVCETCGAEQASSKGAQTGDAPVKIGDVIGGRYEIRGEIGEGATGRVFRAQDREVDVSVALRLIHPELVADAETRKQFKATIRKSRDVLHPGCVKIYEADVDSGLAYVTMEFVGGLSLRRLLSVRTNERRPFKLAEAEPMLAQIVAALTLGHSKGVCHLSISPGNVLIQPEGLKLTDFGLSAMVPAAKRKAAADKYKSTPYVSPQYLKGEAPAVSDDIFSLGAVLFEMVTLQTPAPGISLSDVVEGLPDEADDLIADCLSENTAKRPKTAAEVLARWQKAIEREAAIEQERKEAAAKPPPPPPPKPAPVEVAPPPPPPPPPPPKAEPVALKAEPPKVETPKAEPPRAEPPPPPKTEPAPKPPAAEPIPESWAPPAQKKGPPVGIIIAAVVVIAAVGLFFSFSGGDEKTEPSKPVASAAEKTSEPEKPALPETKEPEKVAEPAKPETAAPVSITEPEPKPAEAAPPPPKETSKETAKPVKEEPAAKPAKAEEKKPEKQKAVAAAEPPPSSGNCPAGMAFVPGGSFKMGSSPDDSARDFAEKSLTPTGVPEFCIDRYESPNTEGSQPRSNVTWNEAKSACEGQGKRLCSEAEWEKACKGPKETRYPYGDLFNAKSCNTRDQAGQDRALAPSGKYSQCTNSYGAFDLSGNLREWTSTAWSESSLDKVVRGGSHSRPDWATRCAFRENFQPATKDSQIGYRCCK